jgi:hypothetical protein
MRLTGSRQKTYCQQASRNEAEVRLHAEEGRSLGAEKAPLCRPQGSVVVTEDTVKLLVRERKIHSGSG